MSAPPEVSADGLFADIARVIWLNDHGAAERLTKAFRVPPARTLAGLHIHASTTRHTLAGALAEAVPSVAAAMPDDAFAGLAAAFIAEHPPRRAALHARHHKFAKICARSIWQPPNACSCNCVVGWDFPIGINAGFFFYPLIDRNFRRIIRRRSRAYSKCCPHAIAGKPAGGWMR